MCAGSWCLTISLTIRLTIRLTISSTLAAGKCCPLACPRPSEEGNLEEASPESQGQNLVLTVLFVPSSLDTGGMTRCHARVMEGVNRFKIAFKYDLHF